jgi:TatD DNase family protein
MIDSHAHVASELFDSDREEMISRTLQNGVTSWIEVGTTLLESEKAVALAQKYPQVRASVGVHPDDIHSLQEKDWTILELLARTEKVCAIGEVGFDTFRNGKIEEQEPTLRRFIELAQKIHKPVIYHVRSGNGVDAHTELLRVLSSYSRLELPPGVIHTFSGNLEQAQHYIDIGMKISFSGVITFKNSGELPEIVRNIPLSSILVETDCPFLTPEPFRGQRNEPSYVRYTLQKIAELRKLSFEEMEKITEENSVMLFGD